MVSAVGDQREAYQLAVDARDPRFDGVFYVGITTTHVYCRPCCPSRLAYDRHRRFFDSAAAAERAGFRPCMRCRPELAPGRATALAAVSRLAQVASQRIAAGALNGRSVANLASELGVSERHLRRALEREVRVSPLELAQTHRLLLAKRLIVDTDLPMTRVAYASGFQSLRRFNTVFRAQYRMAPSALRRGRKIVGREDGSLRLTLAYRPPLAWDALASVLPREAKVAIDGQRGIVAVENSAADHHLAVTISESLLPVLMPLIAGLRRVFDLDAEPGSSTRTSAREGWGISWRGGRACEWRARSRASRARSRMTFRRPTKICSRARSGGGRGAPMRRGYSSWSPSVRRRAGATPPKSAE